VVDVRVCGARAGRAAAMASDPAGLERDEARCRVREAGVGGAVPALAAVSRVPWREGS
jgi:hypothetical protein